MNDPFGRNAQQLTDALLQLDRAISVAESNVAAAKQLGLPEAAAMGDRLPYLVQSARAFLAGVPDMSQPQRWGEGRRLLDKAMSYQPHFAPYMLLGQRVTMAKAAVADQAARSRAMADAARRARQEHDVNAAFDAARRRFSQVRQTLADMQLQRGPGFDDQEWQDGVRSVASILTAQDVRLAAAAASVRDGALDEAQAQLDQALGELQAALDLAQRARVGAGMRGQSPRAATQHITMPMPDLQAEHQTPHRLVPPSIPPPVAPPPAPPVAPTQVLSLIEPRTGTLFRCDGRATVLGRGLDRSLEADELYIDLSRSCDPGEAEYLGISRRHCEIERHQLGFAIRDLGSTNGTRLRHVGQTAWETLPPHQWTVLREADTLQFGLLECTITLA